MEAPVIEHRLIYPPVRIEYRRQSRSTAYPEAPGQAYHLRPDEREPQRVAKGR
jgi:hypothetical protein